jgi:hypothetical protein
MTRDLLDMTRNSVDKGVASLVEGDWVRPRWVLPVRSTCRCNGSVTMPCSVTDCDCTDFERDELECWAVEALADQFSVCVCGHEEDEHGV